MMPLILEYLGTYRKQDVEILPEAGRPPPAQCFNSAQI